ncbi:probable enzyme activator VAC14 [Cephalotrichum gorgonifer]|uniref:Probable enzyme activator VAC14 n=1 Tax=Cephalotrichum gorgonifer TaxID=2041049 RepID=A0AAE8SU53_9PEZI|nr:probable enzyme activator VAC14 [Cephalotrichum gorgonifer]
MDTSIQRSLNDKLYEKRKIGALEYVFPRDSVSFLALLASHCSQHSMLSSRRLAGHMTFKSPPASLLERVIRELVTTRDYAKVNAILEQLCNDFAYAVHQPHARNGGLIGLAAAAIALGQELPHYLSRIVPPVLACFTDQDARVRYYACEAMYNIAKVAKGEILIYFNDIFDALCKLGADSELSVKNGAELLDRLVKDIVAESASSYVSILQLPPDHDGDEDKFIADNLDALPTAFSLPRFIPLLKERIWVMNPFTRQFLVGWITLLDSIPDLELVAYLPDFLGGLLKFLSDSNKDVHVATRNCLDKFLNEIKRISHVRKGISESKKSKDGRTRRAMSLDGDSMHSELEEGDEVGSDDEDGSSEVDWIPGQDVHINYRAVLEILTANLDSPLEEDSLLESLRWIVQFLDICPEEVLPFTPKILAHMLPAMASGVESIRQAAGRVNGGLMDYVVSLSDDTEGAAASSKLPVPADRGDGNSSTRVSLSSNRDADSANTLTHHARTGSTAAASTSDSAQPTQTDLDYAAAVNSLTLLFLNDHEATRVAALTWLIMLHRKAPRKVLAFNDGTFPALLKTLSDPSDAVVTKDLQLLSQISRNSEDDYFANFMVNLLQLFSTDRKLLETRGNLIIRQLCVSLSPERIYRTLADCIEKEEDVEFASIMVQNLNNNLITAPQLSELRKRLRNLEPRDGQLFFVALFRSWCYNAVATFSLCLLAQAYEQAYNLLQIFAELDMTVNMLIQVDKLVQLIESPVFTCSSNPTAPPYILECAQLTSTSLHKDLRLQLLEPERYPYLYKCLYGLLMLLPQSSAFAALRNRLNSVSPIGYLHIPPRASSSTPGSSYDRPPRLKGREEGIIRWGELLEKFRSVQERARRSQMYGGDADDGPQFGFGDLRIGDTVETKGGKEGGRAGNSTPVPTKDAGPVPALATKARTGFGKQLGRFGGAVAGRGKRNAQ